MVGRALCGMARGENVSVLKSLAPASPRDRHQAGLIPAERFVTSKEAMNLLGYQYDVSPRLLVLARLGLIVKQEELSKSGFVLRYLWKRA